MSGITNSKLIAVIAALGLMMVSDASFARDNTLTGGLSVSFDYDDRQYEPITDDPDTPVNEADLRDDREEDYRTIRITPLVHFRSLSARDSFELRAAPAIKYDLLDYETDWDNNLYVAADRFMTRSWQLRFSNHFIRSDEHETDTAFSDEPVEPSEEVSEPADPELSSELGRRRYWRNTLNLLSDYTYYEDSLFQLGFNYITLRNDDTGVGGYEDYDRYTASIRNVHRFNSKWRSIVDLRFIRGDFEPTDPAVVDAVIGELAPDADVTPTEDELSNDLKEYRVLLTVDNESIERNPLSMSYNYIGAKYDEVLRDDSDIHQLQFIWRHDFSPRMYSRLGIGPSYEKTEGRDANWGGNGIVELDYRVEHGNFNFLVEKGYDVDNFAGSDEGGLVDFWETRFSFRYDLFRDLTLTGRLSYLYQDREDPVVAIGRALASDDPLATLENEDLVQLQEYHTDRYLAGVGLSYTFWQFYTAGLDYTFSKQESDRIGDDYDDHRLLLTLSWEQELFHW